MRYVIVCVVTDDAGNFNNNLRKDLFEKFNVKSSKLPAHLRLKHLLNMMVKLQT